MARKSLFHLATEEEILKGRVTDVYFLRTQQILRAKRIHRRVKAEFVVKKFPNDWPWGVFAGLEAAASLLKTLKLSARSVPEGTFFRTGEPVLVIEGDYLDMCVYETALLGLLCQASGIATKSARCRKLAGDRKLFSFGSRRIHPALSPMVERSAYLGGCDGVSSVKGAAFLGMEPVGTMPHALILLLGGSKEATLAFHEIIDQKVKRVSLIDTMGDEKFEAVGVARALGKHLSAVRLDTPSSRRGNFADILKEVRWELDLRGFKQIQLFVSGGIDESDFPKLNPWVYGYGVGTAISSSAVLDFAMDIVEIEGTPMAKRGKLSGEKELLRCLKCSSSIIFPAGPRLPQRCHCAGRYEPLLKPLLADGRLQKTLPSAEAIRRYVLKQLPHYPLEP